MKTYNNLEEYIVQLLDRISIYDFNQLNVETIFTRMGIAVHYIPHGSMYIDGIIFLDSRKNSAEQWQDFAHELCHALWHAGDQALIPLSMREYQEWKAENFAQHLCIPTFMLDRLDFNSYESDATRMIMKTFGVTQSFAERRLRQYMTNLQYG